MISLAILLAAVPQKPADQFFAFGIGNSSCATAMAPARSAEAEIWIMGYWSGLNEAFHSMSGSESDADGIMAEVRLRCLARPSAPIYLVTLDLWKSMQHR